MSFYKINFNDGGHIYFTSNVKFIMAPSSTTIIDLAIREDAIHQNDLKAITNAKSVSYEEYSQAILKRPLAQLF